MSRSVAQLLTEHWYGNLDHHIILQWAYDYIASHNAISDEVYQLLNALPTEYEGLLLGLAQQTLTQQNLTTNSLVQHADVVFTQDCYLAERLAAEYLLQQLINYGQRRIKPATLCQLIARIETNFLGASRGLPSQTAYYPACLGDLWNACDWCDDTWTYENSLDLNQQVKIQIKVIQTWLESHNRLKH